MHSLRHPFLFLAIFCLAINTCSQAALKNKSFFTFISQYIKNPTRVGAIAESSPFVAKKIVTPLKKDLSKQSRCICEIGAGMGALTERIVKELREGDVLDVVELDPAYVEVLRKKFNNNPQVRIHQADILTWQAPCKQYDFIIASLPMLVMETAFVQELLKKYKELIKPGGTLSYIEYVGMTSLRLLYKHGAARIEWKKKVAMLRAFKQESVHTKTIVLFNIPPTYVHHLQFKQPENKKH